MPYDTLSKQSIKGLPKEQVEKNIEDFFIKKTKSSFVLGKDDKSNLKEKGVDDYGRIQNKRR